MCQGGREYFVVEPTTFLSLKWQKTTHWENELLNVFRRWSYKNSYSSKLVYKSSVLLLMICSFKDVLEDLSLDFVLFVLKVCC